jgi:hypothetical protein
LGWRIRPAEEDGTITITGNLYPRNPSIPILIPTVGDYTAMISMERDASSVVELVGGGSSDWTSTEKGQIRHRLGIDGSTNAPSASSSLVSGVWAYTVENSVTAVQGMRRIFAALFGRTQGVGTLSPEVFKSLDNTKDRVTMDYDSNGNRINPTFDDT